MNFAKELFVGALLGGSALSALAVDPPLDFEPFIDKTTILTYPGISGLSFENALAVHNAGPQIYFPTTLANGDGAMAVPTGEVRPNVAITGILTFSAGLTGVVSFDYVTYDLIQVKARSGSNLIDLSSAESVEQSASSILSFKSTDSLGGCSFQSTVAKTACNWRHVSVSLGSTATSIEFGFANTSNDGTGFIDNVHYQTTAAVPEPAAYALMALGLLGIGFARRRQMS